MPTKKLNQPPPEEPREEVEFSFGKWKAVFRTANNSAALLLILLAALFLYIAKSGEAKADDRASTTNATLVKVQKALDDSQEANRTVIYVLSLPQGEREELSKTLAKPQFLKDMQK